MNDLSAWYYLVLNIFNTYIISRYFDIFFEGQKKFNKYVDGFIILSYYLVISFVYLSFNIPLLTMFTNIVMFFIITILYHGTFKKKVLSVTLIYSVLLLTECVAVLILALIKENVNARLGAAISQIISVFLLGLFQRRCALKDDILIPKLQLVCIIVFPIGGMILFYLVTTFASDFIALICLIILLLFNVLIIYIFDEINAKYKIILSNELTVQQKQHEIEIYKREKTIYEKQLEIIEQNQEEIRMLRHDFNGHLMTLSGLCQEGNADKVLKYLSRLLKYHEKTKQYIDTGNIAIDSILNFNIQAAIEKNIVLKTNIKIPSHLDIEAFDMSIILGNIIQNALEATQESEKKYIYIKMNYDRGMLFIEVDNTYNNQLIKKDNTFLTTKEDNENHGLGLKNVRNCIERYYGEIEFDVSEQDVFKVFILLYV